MADNMTAAPAPDSSDGDVAKAGKTWAAKPTEFAQGMAALVSALPPQTAQDLMRLLGHSLAAPSSAEIREARLGLMLDPVADGSSEFVAVERYEAERDRRRTEGELWPAHATLIAAYGDWVKVVSAAMTLCRDGMSAGVPHSNHHRRNHRRYTRQDVVQALRHCRSDLGDWPGELEYYEWARIGRILARDAGNPTDCFPTRSPIRKLFGDYARALHVAQRHQDGADERA